MGRKSGRKGIVLGVSDLAPDDEVPSTFTEGSICVVNRQSLGVNHNGRFLDCCCLLQALSGAGTRRLGSAVDFGLQEAVDYQK